MNFIDVDIQLLQENRTSDKQRVVHYFRSEKWCQVFVKWIRCSQVNLGFRIEFLGSISPSSSSLFIPLYLYKRGLRGLRASQMK